MNAETTSSVGTRSARAQARPPSATSVRESSGGATLREAFPALIANAAP